MEGRRSKDGPREARQTDIRHETYRKIIKTWGEKKKDGGGERGGVYPPRDRVAVCLSFSPRF